MQPYGNVDDEAGVDYSEESEIDDENLIFDEAVESETQSSIGKKREIVNRFAFFDFETTQSDPIGESKLGTEFEHRPNLCVARVICDDCRNRDFEGICGRCGVPEHVFEGVDCVNDFCRFLFNKFMKNTIAIAHNARGFDAHFVMQYLSENGISPEVIARGMLNALIISYLMFKFRIFRDTAYLIISRKHKNYRLL